MSQKSKKAATSTTPISESSYRSTSPLSPTRTSRLQEKTELQGLNDRLAAYIERVRFLEADNARLQAEIHTTQETITRETSNLKSIFEHELSDARKLLDETAREKAKLEIEKTRLWEENDDLKNKLDKATKSLNHAESNARLYESRCSDLSGKYSTARNDLKKVLDENQELKKEVERLRKLLEEARKNLEEETLARVEFENAVQSLREELTFKDTIHTQELQETRTRRQVEITEIDGKLSEQYEQRLQQSLQELRDQYEERLRSNRDEIEALYDTKLKNLQHAASRNSNTAATALEELRITKTKIDGLNSRITELEAANNALHARLRDLEKEKELERIRYTDEITLRDNEIARLRDEIAQMVQDYQDLTDIRVSLDLELAAYDKLLKGEEYRLNIPSNNVSGASTSLSQSMRSGRKTPTTGRRPPSRASQQLQQQQLQPSGQKRKRAMVEESEDRSVSDFYVSSTAKGDIEIIQVDPEGKFVKLRNKGKKEINIGGWQLVRVAGDNETIFKFHRSVKIDAGSTTTIWSSDSGADHEPPTNIVMKQQRWFTSDNMKTTLINIDGEEVASSERVKQQVATHAARHRYSGIEGERLYHQQVRTSPATNSSNSSQVGFQRGEAIGEENCLIM